MSILSKSKWLLPLSFMASTWYVQAYDTKDLNALIKKESVYAQLAFLSSDALQGREVGSIGGKVAAEYIVQQLREWGISPFLGNGYLQTFQFEQPDKNKGVNSPHKLYQVNNVLGMIEGKKKDEIIVIGAHYDHLGIKNAIEGDSIYNGADDNASGTVAVLQLAKAFAQKKKQPERTLVFAFWDGEEKGLWGSTHFVSQYPNLNKIKAYINFDMIGRNNDEQNPTQFVYFYTQKYPLFEKWMKQAIQKHQLPLSPNYRPWDKPIGGSDNTPFAKKEIPIIWFHTDAQPDMHKPSDEVEKINLEKATAIIQAAYHLADCLSKFDF